MSNDIHLDNLAEYKAIELCYRFETLWSLIKKPNDFKEIKQLKSLTILNSEKPMFSDDIEVAKWVKLLLDSY